MDVLKEDPKKGNAFPRFGMPVHIWETMFGIILQKMMR